jgi:hypothetical protein
MTVGIAAVCEAGKPGTMPKIVLAADRMITTGANPRIEYEHTKSKIETVHDNGVVSCMGVASGTVTLIEQFFNKLDQNLAELEPASMENIATVARESYVEVGRETVENRVLDQFGLTVEEVMQEQGKFESDVLKSFLNDIADGQEEFSNQLEVLLCGVDGMGGYLYEISNFDLTPQNNVGYHAVGSGNQPARSVFIRNEYDTSCGIDEAIINIIEAKHRSEEARGVGQRMDIATIEPPVEDAECCTVFSSEVRSEWQAFYKEILSAEKDAREDIMSDPPIEYDHGGSP